MQIGVLPPNISAVKSAVAEINTRIAAIETQIGADPSGAPGRILDVRRLGIPGDGSDQTDAFNALGDLLRQYDGTHVLFPGGDYVYANNKWMVGVRNVRIIGADARFRCTAPLTADTATLALWVNRNYWRTAVEGGVYSGSYKFASVGAGATEIVCLTSAEAGNFQAGDVVLLSGYEIYPGGWPPSCRYTEIAEVAAANAETGAVTLTRQIRYGYDQRWRDNGTTAGAPRVMQLSRRTGWTLAEDIYIEGITFMRGTHEPAGMSPYTYGGVYAIGARRITTVRCKMGNLNPSCVERFIATDCEIDNLEVDKFDDRVTFERCKIRRATGGTGSNKLVFRDCELLEQVQIQTKEVDLDGCDVYASDPLTGFAIVTAQAHTTTVTRSRLYRRAAENLAAYNVSGTEVAITPSGVGAGLLKCALNLGTYEPMKSAFVGNRIYTKTHPLVEGTISAVWWDGSALVIEADFSRDPLLTDTFYVNRTKHVSLWGNSEMHRTDIGGLPSLPFPQRADLVRWDEQEGQGRMGRMLLPFPARTDNEAAVFMLPGYPLRVLIDVVDAVAGYRLTVYPTGQPYWSIAIDCSQAGLRSVDPFAAQGALGTDSIATWPAMHTVYDQMNMLWSVTPGTLPRPKGYLIWEYLCPPGAR